VNDPLKQYRGYVLIVLVCLVLIGATFILVRRPAPEPVTVVPAATSTPTRSPAPSPTLTFTPTPAPLRVYVSGAVRTPDVYILPAGSIVNDAVQAAGGPADDADLDRINLALPLSDHQQVYVPRVDETTPAAPLPGLPPAPTPTASRDKTGPASPGGKVNINTATVEQLDTLPGIGPAIAQRIVDYRQANGPFSAPEDIMNVKGIGEATFEELRDLITVE